MIESLHIITEPKPGATTKEQHLLMNPNLPISTQ